MKQLEEQLDGIKVKIELSDTEKAYSKLEDAQLHKQDLENLLILLKEFQSGK